MEIILQNDEERKEELEETIDALNKIYDDASSKDIKSDILDLVTNYETELQDIENRLAEEYEKEMKYMNLEYERSVS